VLGFARGLDFFSTEGEDVLGLSSNGLLSTVSVVTAAVLLFAAFRSARTASTIMMGIGALFLLSALVSLALLRTHLNVLAFEMANVIFSIVAGLVLLTLGAYGRVSGRSRPTAPTPARQRTPAPARTRTSTPRRGRRWPRPPCARRRSPSSSTGPPPSSAAGSRRWPRWSAARTAGGCGRASTSADGGRPRRTLAGVMHPSPARARGRADACPGALQTHAAADGALARIRLPGGALTAAQLRALGAAARDLGDGALELTSRGNMQLRGLGPGADAELAARLSGAGLLPGPAHDRVRNVLASTLSGRVAGGHVDARGWAAAFDAALCADPALAALPGRFLVTLDDGRGDVAGLGGDVALLALDRRTVALTLAGADSGLRTEPGAAVGLALAATRAYLDERTAQGGTAWRLGELLAGPAAVVARLGGSEFPPVPVPRPAAGGPVGVIPQVDGRVALVAAVPFGRLAAGAAELLAGAAADLQVIPWRSIAVPDVEPAAARQLAGALTSTGLVLDPGSPWLRVTACTGLPGCAKSLADVRADATAAVLAGHLPAEGARQHWAGCERRCGRPRGDVVDIVATGSGYRVGWYS
jgi:precorrin-3B synthase